MIGKEKIDLFLEKISDYFYNQNKVDDSLICPKHKIEHTGKNVYSIIVDVKLFKLTQDEKYFDRAKKRALRTVKNLVKDPDFNNPWIFWPGRLDGRNMSNSVIDSGACSDSLSYFYNECENLLSKDEKDVIKDAIYKNCDTYLKQACVGKEITNQRLWGATGIANAYTIFKEESWKEAVINSIELSLSEMLGDGTFPYHSKYKEYKIDKGIYDTTPFYHSRHVAFIYYALEKINIDVGKYKNDLIKATDLLIGMYQEDGIKNINLEIKRWYFLSDYEVVSNSYDIYAFVKTYNVTKNDIYLEYAYRSFDKLLSHQFNDGGVSTHLGHQDNFQCRIFWTANCTWLAKVYDDLISLKEITRNPSIKYYKDSDILKFRNNDYACTIRGSKRSQNVAWGPRIGGGSLLYFGKAKEGYKNLLTFNEWSGKDPLNFYIKSKSSSFVERNKKDLKGLLYYVKVEIKARNIHAVVIRTIDFFNKIFERYSKYASHFSGDVVTNFDGNTITFKSNISSRGGDVINGIEVVRNYNFSKGALFVKELLKSERNISNITYIKHPTMKEIEIKTDMKYKDSKTKIVFRGIPGTIEINFSL